jgi:serine/threonine protein kinase
MSFGQHNSKSFKQRVSESRARGMSKSKSMPPFGVLASVDSSPVVGAIAQQGSPIHTDKQPSTDSLVSVPEHSLLTEISTEADDFVRSLLDRDPHSRPDAEAALRHSFIHPTAPGSSPSLRPNIEAAHHMGVFSKTTAKQHAELEEYLHLLRARSHAGHVRSVQLAAFQLVDTAGTVSEATTPSAISEVSSVASSTYTISSSI